MRSAFIEDVWPEDDPVYETVSARATAPESIPEDDDPLKKIQDLENIVEEMRMQFLERVSIIMVTVLSVVAVLIYQLNSLRVEMKQIRGAALRPQRS